eukprot:11887020-Alexandrium_andersonii.AAC.1
MPSSICIPPRLPGGVSCLLLCYSLLPTRCLPSGSAQPPRTDARGDRASCQRTHAHTRANH